MKGKLYLKIDGKKFKRKITKRTKADAVKAKLQLVKQGYCTRVKSIKEKGHTRYRIYTCKK